VFEQQGQTHEIEGKVIVTAADGGKLLLAPDGAVWAVEPDQLQSHEKTAAPFEPLDADQLEAQLRSNLPAGFEVHRTARYMICYNTSRAYAQWCGALFERLYRAFHNFWQRRGLELHPPEFPLVAVVFDSQQSYEKYSRGELGDAVDSIVGYYSLRTNRISMYDLTGVQALLIYEIGEREMPASTLRARGAFAGTSLSYNVKKLQEAGYLEQRRSEADKRTVHLTLTDRGLKVRTRVAQLFERQAEALEPTASVRKDDLSQLNRNLSRLERFWSDQIRYRL